MREENVDCKFQMKAAKENGGKKFRVITVTLCLVNFFLCCLRSTYGFFNSTYFLVLSLSSIPLSFSSSGVALVRSHWKKLSVCSWSGRWHQSKKKRTVDYSCREWYTCFRLKNVKYKSIVSTLSFIALGVYEQTEEIIQIDRKNSW